jgi:hypothetical protein
MGEAYAVAPPGWAAIDDGEPAPLPSDGMEINVTADGDGHAYLTLGEGEVRDSVELSAHEEADRIPALDSLVLHFDHYGRLTAIEVTDSAPSVLPPKLLDS